MEYQYNCFLNDNVIILTLMMMTMMKMKILLIFGKFFVMTLLPPGAVAALTGPDRPALIRSSPTPVRMGQSRRGRDGRGGRGEVGASI